MEARRVIGSGAIICAIVAPLIALWRSGVIGPQSNGAASPSTMLAERRNAQQIYGTASFRPLAETTNPDHIEHLLETGFVENHAQIADDRVPLLIQHASEFLFERFCQPEGSRYIRWRADNGYRLRDRDHLFEAGPVGRTYIAITTTDDPMAPSDEEVATMLASVTIETMFLAAWDFGIADRGGSGTPAQIATSPDWIGISISRAAEPKGGGRPLLDGRHGQALWYGTSAASPLQWWQPGSSREALRGVDGKIVFADVGALVRFADRSFKPVVCTFAWDDRNDRWWLLHMTVQNSPAPIAGISY